MDKTDRKTGGFSSLGEFLVAVRKVAFGESKDFKVKALTEGTDSQGGFTVPETWADEILSIPMEAAIVRPRAIIQPMASDTLDINGLVDSDRSSSIYGGVTRTWTPEATTITSYLTTPSIGQVQLTAHEMLLACETSNVLQNDARGLEAFVKTAFGRALAFYEDYDYIWGTGSGQPLGIMNSGAMLSVARTNGFGAPITTDLGVMAARLLPDSWGRAVWLINQTVLSGWAIDATSGSNVMGIIDLSTMTCLGRPIIVTEKCSAAGTTGDVILADFGCYVIGNRELIVRASGDVPDYWQANKTIWQFVLRGDGKPTFSTPITPTKGGSTLSAFVALTTAS
jgi:HK97 family phage major capsid protein